MDNSKSGHIPMQERLDLNKTQGASTPKEVKRMQNVPYASAVGSIMYAIRCTRPDVAFAQNITSRFQQNPGELYWTAVKDILKYLRNTKDMFLVYGGNPEAELRVDCYCDTGFETDIDDMKSQTRYVSFSEMEAAWIRKFVSRLGIVLTINELIRIFCDNLAALHFANDPGFRWAPDTTIEILRICSPNSHDIHKMNIGFSQPQESYFMDRRHEVNLVSDFIYKILRLEMQVGLAYVDNPS
ncbi:hypothetical protein Tco_1045102 [Tanacetum coccineum]|uniref:Retrotransposon protein, putative, Ty1-copia subclass n=1 Tax=Tanacetum coccineum TaxID=301880 RepID=A0ABQ5GRT6_9ASTR